MHDRIIDGLTLEGRHTRSISLDRDLNDPRAIEGYLLTPNAISALKQIGESLTHGHAQRAWKLVGPYGSGKSALGILLAQALSGKSSYPKAWQALNKVAPGVARHYHDCTRYPIALVGARMSIGHALAMAARQTLDGLGKSKTGAGIRRHLDVERGTYKGMSLSAHVGELLDDLAMAAQAQGFGGLVLLIDEVGKFVEHAALHPDQGDLIALQQIAEHASKAGDDKLMVVAMLHQHFASYAAGVGRALNDEWHKVASRFEEIPFDEPIERYAHFASHALGVKPRLLEKGDLRDAAQNLYGTALELGVLRAMTTADKALFDQPACLYPLHPLSVASLAVVSKRYGQSERSFHAFLRGHEPQGLVDFVHRIDVDAQAWFRLPDVFDYLAAGYGLRFRDLGSERRWAFAMAAVERHSDHPITAQVLKSIAVLELVQSDLAQEVTSSVIAFALGSEVATSRIEETLAQLVERGVLIHRRRKTEFAFAVSDAVNVEALYERAARSGESDLILRGISRLLSKRLVVANKHYDRTGTIRTLGVVVGVVGAWPAVTTMGGDDLQPDAWLKLILLSGDEDAAAAAAWLQDQTQELQVCGCLRLSAEGRAALVEFSIWQEVLQTVNSKHLDPWTSRYVEGRLQHAHEAVGRLVTSELIPTPGREGPAYWHQGRPIPDSSFMNTNQLASWLFDKVYFQAPRIINELINKDKPTSAIVLARQRMFDVLLGNDPTRQICGPSEFPPERLIHTSLLRQTGIWEEVGGRWRLVPPSVKAENDISAVWAKLSSLLCGDEPVSFEDVLGALAAPPLGLRAGPAGIWGALYLMIHRGRCAVFERGTLLLEVSAEHLQRMFKNPQAFKLRELTNAESNKRLLADYRAVLASIGCAFEGEPSYLELARSLYRWSARLPDFAKQTLQISKDAALVRSMLKTAGDPIELLTQSFPALHVQAKSKKPFGAWLTTTLSDLGMAHRRLQDAVTQELSTGFAISGPLSRVRSQLQAECAASASHLADARLRGFLLRCTDLSLTDEKWLDSVGSLIVQRPLDAWDDETLGKFGQALTELCAHYRRWMNVVMQRGKAPRAAERFMGLTLTLPGGQETSVFVATSDAARQVADNVLDMIDASTGNDHELASAALAQALLDLQARTQSPSEERKNYDDQREAG
ncbi:hypothetical protein GIY62_10830 [Burkholderia plantarii]|uniref:hypothetical protein n=1 Tax=Burkholderia plantarii TaxID=41899 RepID=UPI00272D5FF8|nr:hypothetical protein [Burkholderia plantarii]WLE57660.1 hypothetical protein GIY62_10830 [Burkholderia plantarii]